MRPVLSSALAGLVAALAALGASELVAGLLPGAPSLVLAIGGLIVDLQPAGAKDLVVALFGTNDKLALELFVGGVALALAAGLGVVGQRRFQVAVAGFGLAGLLAFVAALQDPLATPVLAALNAGLAAGVGVQVLSWLSPPVTAPATAAADWARRRLLIRGGSLAVASVGGGLIGRALLQAQRAIPTEAMPEIPPASPTPPLAAGASLDVQGISPLVVPNDRFYRIDTALILPRVDLGTWQLRVRGMVDREVALTYSQFLELPLFEQYVTIACVSNEVGGDLVGNAKWTGARLLDVLEMAGVQAGATQIVGRSVDGWTAGFPTAWAMAPERESMIAVAMNDEPLPLAHGFPARLIVPGLYGYVSATKWLSEIELTTLEAFDAYWVPLGWAKEAPILTQSRIDTPRSGARLTAGRVVVAGVAWAPDRGVSRVEVAVDGVWAAAVLSTPISDATWVQWRYDWEATPGSHAIVVRATDGAGETQTELKSPPAPDGARGHHTITVVVG